MLVLVMGLTTDVAIEDSSRTWSIASSKEFEGGPMDMSVSSSVRA